jgi:hypothetical protein
VEVKKEKLLRRITEIMSNPCRYHPNEQSEREHCLKYVKYEDISKGVWWCRHEKIAHKLGKEAVQNLFIPERMKQTKKRVKLVSDRSVRSQSAAGKTQRVNEDSIRLNGEYAGGEQRR